MTAEQLGDILVSVGVIDAQAIDDPECYDDCRTLRHLGNVIPEIEQALMDELASMTTERNIAVANVSKQGRRVVELEAIEEKHLADIQRLAAERDTLRATLALIRDNGGITTDEGLSCNGAWCAEQARCALMEKGVSDG